MPEYKDTIVCWLNKSKNGDGLYLTINDVEKETKTFVNMHKFWTDAIRDAQEKGVKFPKVPIFAKSVKIEGSTDITDSQDSDISNDVPF